MYKNDRSSRASKPSPNIHPVNHKKYVRVNFWDVGIFSIWHILRMVFRSSGYVCQAQKGASDRRTCKKNQKTSPRNIYACFCTNNWVCLCHGKWQPVLMTFLISLALLPQVLANSCSTDADCSFCGGYCENPLLVCMCPASFCNCRFHSSADMRCQCPSGHFCGFWSGGSCKSVTRAPTTAQVNMCIYTCK